MSWRGYFGIENLALTNPQKVLLLDELERLGPDRHPQPAYLNHWRYRLDNQAAIYEALFDFEQLTIARTKSRLGTIFGVSPATIGSDVTETSFAGFITKVITFSRAGTDYLRMAIFGNTTSSYDESHAEVLGYLVANLAEWETEPET